MSKLVTIGVLVATLAASASAAGHGVRAHHDGPTLAGQRALVRERLGEIGAWAVPSAAQNLNSCSFISPQRSGGISEMAPCARWGLRGNRAQFVRAITRPVGNRAFLSQLAH